MKTQLALMIGFVLAAALASHGVLATQPAAIATADQYGTEAAREILDAGGNAVDAAVAVAFTLGVTYPEAGNLGGGGFATIVMDGHEYFLDYREVAPGAATRDMYLDSQGNVIPDASTTGARAVGVPGTVAGLWAMHQRFGHLPWARDLTPAIRRARDGFVPSKMLLAERDERVHQLGTRTNFSRYFAAMHSGETFRQPELEATLKRIATGGADGFYHGRTAALFVSEMMHDGGLISRADLAHYTVRWRTPLTEEWADFRIITAPLPSSGGILLSSMLAMKADLAPAFSGLTLNSAQYVHLLAEIEKRVYADRADYLGDPDFTAAPVAALLAPAYLARRAGEVSLDRPTPTAAVHAGLAQSSEPDPPLAPSEHHNTTHFSIVDHAGNAVSNTYTLNDDFGSGVVVAGAGFVLNDEMDNFSVKPGSPNMYGVVGGKANEIAPGKRPLSTTTPTILTSHGRVALVIGTPGGSHIATSVFQVVTNWHDFHMPLADAVAAIRVHHQLLPADTIFEEPYGALSAAVKTELTARGYRFEESFNGDIQAIACSESSCEAVADPRGRGVALILNQ
jgi:gamma-glutamyltranspeptidase / glutathione hydrolase